MSACQVCEARADNANLCRRCTRTVEKAIAELPALLHELDVTISRQDRGTGAPLYAAARKYVQVPGVDYEEGTTTLPSTPWPFSWDAAELRWVVESTVVTWAHDLAPASNDNPGQVLLARLDDLRAHALAGAIYDEITACHRQLQRAIDRQAPDVFAGRCDAPDVRVDIVGGQLHTRTGVCGADLYAHKGDSEVRCGVCGHVYDLAARLRELAKRVDEEWARPHAIADALTTMDEPVNAATVRKWIERDAKLAERLAGREPPYPLVLQRGIDDDGKPLYRVGDVRARIVAARARMTA